MGTCEYGEEPSGSKNAGNFLTSFRTSWLLKKDSAPWSKYVKIIRLIDRTGLFKISNLVMGGKDILTLNPLTTTVVAPPSNASKWQMGFNSAFKGLTSLYCNLEGQTERNSRTRARVYTI